MFSRHTLFVVLQCLHRSFLLAWPVCLHAVVSPADADGAADGWEVRWCSRRLSPSSTPLTIQSGWRSSPQLNREPRPRPISNERCGTKRIDVK